eukprot:5442987-Prymnesium_polylepis.1
MAVNTPASAAACCVGAMCCPVHSSETTRQPRAATTASERPCAQRAATIARRAPELTNSSRTPCPPLRIKRMSEPKPSDGSESSSATASRAGKSDMSSEASPVSVRSARLRMLRWTFFLWARGVEDCSWASVCIGALDTRGRPPL